MDQLVALLQLAKDLKSTVMAFLRRGSIAHNFRNNRQLQQFVLTDVTTTGRILGTGSFGSVEEVRLEQ